MSANFLVICPEEKAAIRDACLAGWCLSLCFLSCRAASLHHSGGGSGLGVELPSRVLETGPACRAVLSGHVNQRGPGQRLAFQFPAWMLPAARGFANPMIFPSGDRGSLQWSSALRGTLRCFQGDAPRG